MWCIQSPDPEIWWCGSDIADIHIYSTNFEASVGIRHKWYNIIYRLGTNQEFICEVSNSHFSQYHHDLQ